MKALLSKITNSNGALSETYDHVSWDLFVLLTSFFCLSPALGFVIKCHIPSVLSVLRVLNRNSLVNPHTLHSVHPSSAAVAMNICGQTSPINITVSHKPYNLEIEAHHFVFYCALEY